MCVKNYKLFAEQHALTNQVPVSIRFLTRLSRNRVSDCLTSAFVLLSWLGQTVSTFFDKKKNSNFKMIKKGNKIRQHDFVETIVSFSGLPLPIQNLHIVAYSYMHKTQHCIRGGAGELTAKIMGGEKS